MSAAPLRWGGGGEPHVRSGAAKTRSISGTFFGNHQQIYTLPRIQIQCIIITYLGDQKYLPLVGFLSYSLQWPGHHLGKFPKSQLTCKMLRCHSRNIQENMPMPSPACSPETLPFQARMQHSACLSGPHLFPASCDAGHGSALAEINIKRSLSSWALDIGTGLQAILQRTSTAPSTTDAKMTSIQSHAAGTLQASRGQASQPPLRKLGGLEQRSPTGGP